tara:strand:+ start:99637 stop:99993 length:357 start_codon:yes stop_codon:yes gene_type:complete
VPPSIVLTFYQFVISVDAKSESTHPPNLSAISTFGAPAVLAQAHSVDHGGNVPSFRRENECLLVAPTTVTPIRCESDYDDGLSGDSDGKTVATSNVESKRTTSFFTLRRMRNDCHSIA